MRFLFLLVPLVAFWSAALSSGLSYGVSLIVNEFNAVGNAKYLDTEDYSGSIKEDLYFKTIPGLSDGRIQGNGGNWLELVVVEDHLDIRGWDFVWEESYYDDNDDFLGRRSGTVTFSASASQWSDLRVGTILTVSEKDSIGIDTDIVGADRNFTHNVPAVDEDVVIDLSTDLSFAPNAGDWWIHVSTREEANKASPLVTTTVNNPANYLGDPAAPGDFSVTNDDWQITLRDDSGTELFGPIGEDVDAWEGSGVNSREVGKLEEDPTSDPILASFNDGETSTFGQPNVWTDDGLSYTQDFDSLRSWFVSFDGDYNGDGHVDAVDYAVWRETLGSTTDLRANGDNTGPSENVIDAADYAVWRTNYGSVLTVEAVTAVAPEPSSALLLGMLLVIPTARRAML